MTINIKKILKYMLSLHGKEYDFCINHDILFELELLSKNINNSDIETILSRQLLLVKNKDYKIIQDVEINRTYKYIKINNIYKLTPNALKLIILKI
jgi:hypothetical protein